MFLRVFAWFGFAIAIGAVLAFYLSPREILWIFPIPFPAAWGPFLSRNNFAQFLELALPVPLWFGLRGRGEQYIWMAAAMLGAGLASASRAGALLLLGETVLAFVLVCGRSWSRLAWFAALAVALSSAAGADVLLRRFAADKPFEYRREIAQSTMSIIAARPWVGHGPGSFAGVYPAYATFDAGRTVEHAHNDWLEFAVESGVGYAALWAVLGIGIAPRAIRSVWGLGICAVFLHALVDYPFERLGVAVWAFILIGILLGTTEKSSSLGALRN
jgi:O-antigen ligase